MRPLNLSECFCLFSCSKWFKIKFYNVGSGLLLPRHVMAMDTSFSDIHGCCLSCLWAATMHSFIFAHMQCRHSQGKSRKNMAKHPLYSFQSPQQPSNIFLCLPRNTLSELGRPVLTWQTHDLNNFANMIEGKFMPLTKRFSQLQRKFEFAQFLSHKFSLPSITERSRWRSYDWRHVQASNPQRFWKWSKLGYNCRQANFFN